jgi:formate hydrogenlyase subunit 6/NADH:ubiquinone oxidoreductase subunit I
MDRALPLKKSLNSNFSRQPKTTNSGILNPAIKQITDSTNLLLPQKNGRWRRKMAKKNLIPQVFKSAASYFFTKPATTMYPYVKPQIDDNFRGQPVFDMLLCVGCGLCGKECPARAIEMVNVEGKKRPQIRLDKCIFCFQCAETCSRHAITNSGFYELATMDKASLVIKPQSILQTIEV